jgi:hypothetical protein
MEQIFKFDDETKSLVPYQPMRGQPLAANQVRKEDTAAQERDDAHTEHVTGQAAVGGTHPAAAWCCAWCGSEDVKIRGTDRLQAGIIRRHRQCGECRAGFMTWEARPDHPLIDQQVLQASKRWLLKPRKIVACVTCGGRLPARWQPNTPKVYCSLECKRKGVRAKYRRSEARWGGGGLEKG